MHGDGYETWQVQRVRFFWENPKTDLWSPINGFFEQRIIFQDNANQQTKSCVQFEKKKKVVFNWFVLEKFFNENATRKKNTSAIDERSGEKHTF